MNGQQTNELAEKIEVGKNLCVSLIKSSSQRLGLNEPTINWAVEYEKSVFRYVALVGFRNSSTRVYLDADELAKLPVDLALREVISLKINQQIEKSLESIV